MAMRPHYARPRYRRIGARHPCGTRMSSRVSSRERLQEARQLADKGGARQHEVASRLSRRSNEVVLHVRDKSNDGDIFRLYIRLKGAQDFQGLA